jgi:hypothetical protein
MGRISSKSWKRRNAQFGQFGLDKSNFWIYYIRNGYIHHRYKE